MTDGSHDLILPLISVIVPAYNAEKWIQSCCESVFSQTYPNWELILVDDGSKDATFAISREMAAGKGNVTLIHTENGGVCQARNLGMAAAKGEYITFLDADDGLLPNGLEILYCLIRETNADMAAANVNEEELLEAMPEKVCWHGNEALIHALRDHPAGYAVWGKLYRREFLRDVQFAQGRKVHEDSFFVFQCFLKQPTVVVSTQPVLWRTIRPDSASRGAFSDKFFDILYFEEEKARRIEEYYPELEPLAENMRLKANMALLRNFCRTWDRRYLQAERACLRAVREKRGFFQPATKADIRWFWILTKHLYYPYKLVFTVRKRKYGKTITV